MIYVIGYFSLGILLASLVARCSIDNDGPGGLVRNMFFMAVVLWPVYIILFLGQAWVKFIQKEK